MTDTENQANLNQNVDGRGLCYQAGYLPVPLRSVPPEGLAHLKLYLFNGKAYSLYRNIGLKFGIRDYRRLMDNGVNYVYVSVRDHRAYYRTIENSLEKIVEDPKTKLERKSEILYFTSVELANHLMLEPPRKREIDRAANVARATVKLIIQDKDAFSRLFEVYNHDFYTATHMVNVCSTVVSLANKIGIVDQQVLQKIGSGAMLHDIGKLFIPSKVLNTQSKLTEEQFEIIQNHVERGCEHLAKVADLPPETMAVVAEHHEKLDGSGYPRSLAGDQISLMGRLAGIVDTFEAMTSVRPYRERTHSIEDALEYLRENTPEKYDPELVQVFTQLIEQTVNPDDYEPSFDKHSTLSGLNWLEASNMSGRRHQRHYFRLQALLRRMKQINGQWTLGIAERVIVHNISASGLGLLSPQPLPFDENICVSIPRNDTQQLPNLVATVARCVNHGDGWYTIGAQFHKVLPKKTLESFRRRSFVREFYSFSK